MSKIMRKIFFAVTLLAVQTSFGQAVFQSFDLVVSDPAAVVAAMDKYQASPTGQSNTSIAILYQYVAAGDNMATHVVNIVHSSPEEMDANLERNQGSSDQATFFAEVNQAATVTRRWMGQILLTGGSVDNLTNPNPAAMAYFMSVSDPAAYAQAFSNFIGQNEDVGQSFLSSIMADGEDPAAFANSSRIQYRLFNTGICFPFSPTNLSSDICFPFSPTNLNSGICLHVF